MKLKELQGLSDEELIIKEKQIKKDVFALNNQRHMGRVEKPADLRNFRRNIARILTILNERKMDGNKPDKSSKK